MGGMFLAFMLAVALAAQAPAAAPGPQELFQRGQDALDREDDLAAVDAFERAYKLKPSDALLYWMGEAHFQAGHSGQAEVLFKDYLKRLPGGPKAAEAKVRLGE